MTLSQSTGDHARETTPVTAVHCRAGSRCETRLTTRQHWRDLVAEAEYLVKASRAKRLSTQEICVTLGVSRRTLHTAFAEVCGSGPSRHFRERRLDWVREALIEGAHRAAPVKAAALTYGFYSLGQFARLYVARFGEYPSQTAARPVGLEPDGMTFQDSSLDGRPLHQGWAV